MVGFKAFSRSIIGISISIALLLLLICATICLLPPKNSQLTILCNLKGDIIKTDRCTISPEMKTLSKLASQQTSLDGFLKTLQVPQEKLKTLTETSSQNKTYHFTHPLSLPGLEKKLLLCETDLVAGNIFVRIDLTNKSTNTLPTPSAATTPTQQKENVTTNNPAQTTTPKPSHVFRIICVGNSTPLEDPNNKQTYPAILEKILKERFGAEYIEVLNHGIEEISAKTISERLNEYIALQPNLILYYGFGDGIRLAAPDAQISTPHPVCKTPLPLDTWANKLPDQGDTISKEIEEALLADLKTMLNMFRVKNINTAFCTFACLDAKSATQQNTGLWFGKSEDDLRQLPGASFTNLIDKYNQLIEQMCNWFSLVCVPTGKGLRENATYFDDLCHLNQDGIQHKAKITADTITEQFGSQIACRQIEETQYTSERRAELHVGDTFVGIEDNSFSLDNMDLLNGVSPMRISPFKDTSLFFSTGLNFEHIYSGRTMDNPRSMFTPRRDNCILRKLPGESASLFWPAENSTWGLECTATFTVPCENTIDMDFSVTPKLDCLWHGKELPWVALQWASYMNSCRERAAYFIGDNNGKEEWLKYEINTNGKEPSNIVYYAADPLPKDSGLYNVALVENPTKKFRLPFYYILLDGDTNPATTDDTTAFIVMFDQKESIRFLFASYTYGTHGPACDWQFLIRDPKIGTEYKYKTHVVCKKFISQEDVLNEYRRWKFATK